MLAKYINQLLHEYNCVVVPNLGGFVANYAPAVIDTVHSTLNPPHKKIVFNKGLSNNDGLLAHAVAADKKVLFNQAMDMIAQEEEAIQKKLNDGESVFLESIGALFCDKENNILFAPDHVENFLSEAYGLSAIRVTAIKKEYVTERLERQFKDRPAIPSEAKKFAFKKYAPLLLVLPLAIALYWIPAKTNLIQDAKISLGGLNPFAKETTQVIVPATQSSAPATIETKEKIDPSVSEEAKAEPSKNYFIIGGSFSVQENAEKYIQQINRGGNMASIVGQSVNGFYRVSINRFNSQEEAEMALATIKQENPGAWVLAE